MLHEQESGYDQVICTHRSKQRRIEEGNGEFKVLSWNINNADPQGDHAKVRLEQVANAPGDIKLIQEHRLAQDAKMRMVEKRWNE